MVESQEEVWDEIAEPWSRFRTRIYPDLVEFLKDKEGNILDIGCGSGRHFKKINGTIYGVDFSQSMLNLAEKNAKREGINVKLTKSNVSKLPFEDNFFDSALFIATLHCIKKKEYRKKSLQELFRILKPKSKAMITTWSKNHQRVKKLGNTFIPWTRDGKKYQRFHYIYTKEEIEKLVKEVGFEIINSKEENNITLVVQKP